MLDGFKANLARRGYPLALLLAEVGLMIAFLVLVVVTGRPASAINAAILAYSVAALVSTLLLYVAPGKRAALLGPAAVRIGILAAAVGVIAWTAATG